MLVLTRKADQEVLIDENIRVRVLSIEGGRVRLGISAPKNVPVTRTELLMRQNEASRSATELEHDSRAVREVNHVCAAIA
jgi:carbon storage regulator